ncbi:MAG: DUF2202 domain-containing protein, partial [Chitinophagales bacterium]|nr:DUF2202 domain-containing protein [Chitinophagales bacterium]
IINSISFILLGVLTMSCQKQNMHSGNSMQEQIASLPKEAINIEERNGLVLMREEEKMAHDVYSFLYDKWNIMIFNNIASSEQTHTDAVLKLLVKYDIDDPASGKNIGVFNDTSLQRMYNQLLINGNYSLLSALTVGATIEDLDIYDLEKLILKADNQDIAFVYNNLLKASRNHMRAFYSQIVNNGGTYRAKYISQQQLEDIVNSPKEVGSWKKSK